VDKIRTSVATIIACAISITNCTRVRLLYAQLGTSSTIAVAVRSTVVHNLDQVDLYTGLLLGLSKSHLQTFTLYRQAACRRQTDSICQVSRVETCRNLIALTFDIASNRPFR
jgi:hypothetical protein